MSHVAQDTAKPRCRPIMSPRWGHWDSRGPKFGSRHAFRPFQGVETTKSGRLHVGNVPPELRLEPHSSRYGQITVLARNVPKWGLGWAERLKTATWYAPRSVSHGPWSPMACHMSSKVDATRWARSTRRFGPPLAYFGPLLALRANGATLGCYYLQGLVGAQKAIPDVGCQLNRPTP